jgi:hypothetical protein
VIEDGERWAESVKGKTEGDLHSWVDGRDGAASRNSDTGKRHSRQAPTDRTSRKHGQIQISEVFFKQGPYLSLRYDVVN